MSNDQMNQLFEMVLTPAPPETTDIDAAMRLGRQRRRRHRAALVLSSAVAIAVVGLTAIASIPGVLRQPAAPAASAPSDGTSGITNRGVAVASAGPLLGTWRAIELGGQDVRNVRDDQGRPLRVTFQQDGSQFRWGANDAINGHSGKFEITKGGRFHADPGTTTAVGTTKNRQLYQDNPEAVERATEARLVPPTSTMPRALLLLADGQVLAMYTTDVSAAPVPAVAGTVIPNFGLYTHCGVREARIGKDYYLADPALDDGQGNPPQGWGNPLQLGTMTAYPDGTAIFTSGKLQAKFVLRRGATAFLHICS